MMLLIFVMFGLFKCKHPFWAIAVEKEHTVEINDADFEHIDYHLFCQKCSERLTLKHAKLIGGVDGFLSRVKETMPNQERSDESAALNCYDFTNTKRNSR